ncbi:hypothetical protein MJO29_008281 [Puccinia striiformis f. sp. tritici]|nr:hypothetical protein MJO29_008281 [Puccinia striiformis f. sp. tritici]
MIFSIDDLEILFPYDKIYPEQYAYMCDLKRTLDLGGHCVLEMPSGTGKTISLLSLIVAYQLYYPERRKLIYCSRTVPEIEKALMELKRLMAYRATQHRLRAGLTGTSDPTNEDDFLGVGLTSRKNLCIHPEVSREKKGKAVDARCRDLTSAWACEKGRADPGSVPLCDFHEKLGELEPGNLIPRGVWTLEEITAHGHQEGICPYFAVRRMVCKWFDLSRLAHADIIIYSFHYLLDPKVATQVSKELLPNSIVVFDEAHNIDNVCIESLSIDLTKGMLDNAGKSIGDLDEKIREIKRTDASKLQNEYERLVRGLGQSDDALPSEEEAAILGNPVLPEDLLQEAVPGNIRRAEHFTAFLTRFVEYLKTRMRVLHVVAETPPSFLQHVKDLTYIDRKPLRFCAERLTSLIRTLELTDLDQYNALQKVASFATLVATYEKGFLLILEPFETENATVPNPVFHLTCLDASLAIKPIFERFSSVIITSGTISPLEMYPKMLGFDAVVQESYAMSLTRNCFLPLVITRGSDQVAISSRFEVRNGTHLSVSFKSLPPEHLSSTTQPFFLVISDEFFFFGIRSDPSVVRNFGTILIDYCKIVPDGIVAFFPSYLYMESIVAAWHDMGILKEVWKYKLIFVETPDAIETSIALENYRRACDNGKGAVLLSVARGKVSEGIDFDHNYGRAVIMFGIPYQYTESRILKARLEFLRDNYRIRENDYLTFDAMRHAAQCVGRVLRGKTDYGLMVFADKRFAKADKRAKLPKWINSYITDTASNLSTDMAMVISKRFLRSMAQPFEIGQDGISLWGIEDILKRQAQQRQADAGGITDVNMASP